MSDVGVVESSPVAQYVIAPDHKVVRWNRACELITGRLAHDVIGTDGHWKPFYTQKRPMLADLVVEHYCMGSLRLDEQRDIVRSKSLPHAWESTGFFENVGGQSRYLKFFGAPVYNTYGVITGAIETLLDITEQKNVEQTLTQSMEGYRILAENVDHGVVLVQNGKFLLANHAFARMFGYSSADQVIGRDAGVDIAESHKNEFLHTLDDPEAGADHQGIFRWPCLTLDDREIWVEGHRRAIKWENKPAYLSTISDITERRARELAIKEKEENLLRENLRLKSSMRDRYKFGDIVGKSPAMQEVYELILNAASSEATVIIYGESGTGKELVARAIHDLSPRHDREFVPVNCGAIPETLLEREFFGHTKGAFTGAHMDKQGYLDFAARGTLFLDEIGELSLNMQAKLLRSIEAGGYTPVGSAVVKKSDFRIIAATHRNLIEQVKKGGMREDFFYRVHIVPIHLPPLRKRKEDIPFLVDHFLQSNGNSKRLSTIPGKIMEALYTYDWPGNVRELQNALHRYLAVGRLDFIHGGKPDNQTIEMALSGEPVEEQNDLKTAVEHYERRLITQALNATKWNRTKAAVLLGIPRKTLFRKMKKYGA